MWPDSDETQELLLRAGRGSDEAVDCLLDRHREALRRMVHSRLTRGIARRVDASDVVQDTMLTASRRLSEYLRDPCMPFHAWLRHLARDRLADVYRRELAAKRNVAREQSVGADERPSLAPAAQACDAGLTPAAMLLRSEMAARFNEAIDRLGDPSREILLMRHGEQLTNTQAAELLGLSEQAASMRYLRALRQLKSLLGESPSEWLE